jgi:xeroderma pigmentosum group C-complementing protein
MLEKPDFRALAVKLEGSRDVGAQLFCAFLRSAGVDARLVCSLQPLPFNATVKTITPRKPKPDRVFEEMGSRPGTSDEDSGLDVQHHLNRIGPTSSGKTDSPSSLVSTRPRRLGHPTFAMDNNTSIKSAPPLKCALPLRILLFPLISEV